MKKFAICQTNIIPGGRLRVVLGIIEALNDIGIVPDLLTSDLSIHTDEILRTYGRQPRAKYGIIPRPFTFPPELFTIAFNLSLKRYAPQYDLLINTSNSLIFLPKENKLMSYIFFPRKRRLMADVVNLHLPNLRVSPWSRLAIERSIARFIYRFSKIHDNNRIICMTDYTRKAIEQDYHLPPNSPTIYPPVDFDKFFSENRERDNAVVTIGRFSPTKRQFEQVQLAEKLPHLAFHIIGLVGNRSYYHQCERYIEEHSLTNVHLHPNLPFSTMLDILHQSRFFLHTLINEPFGLTTAQAIAAGCLPIIHDSGGQREVVVESELCYQNLDEAVEILVHFQSVDVDKIDRLVFDLQRHVKTCFDEAVFQECMKTELVEVLNL